MERAAIPSEDSTLTRHQRIADRVLVPGADLPSQSLPTWGRCQCTQHGEELLGRAGNCWAWALRACGVPCCWSRLAAVVAMHISMGREPEFDSELYLSRAHGEISFRCSALKESVVPAPGTEPWESCRSIGGHVSH